MRRQGQGLVVLMAAALWLQPTGARGQTQTPAADSPAPVEKGRRWLRLLPIGIILAGLLTALGRDLMVREPEEEAPRPPAR